MHPSQLVNRLKVFFCWISACLVGVLGYLDFLQQHYHQAIISYVLVVSLLASAFTIFIRPRAGRRRLMDWLFVIILAGCSLFAAILTPPYSELWMYFFPITIFFLFSLHKAAILLLGFIPVALYVSLIHIPPLDSIQTIFSFSVITICSIFMAVVKSRTNTLLEPLISSDEETGAQLERKLKPALTTEMNRAEREGTGLLLMHVDLSDLKRSQNTNNNLTQSWAKTIHKELRPFDQYYRLAQNGFAIILPHMNTDDGLDLASKIFSHLPINVRDQIKFGLASLNVGDSADSLIEDSRKDLFHV